MSQKNVILQYWREVRLLMEKEKNLYIDRVLKKYGNVKFADEINHKYPIDTVRHIYAAWRFLHMPHNYRKYHKEDATILEQRIINAWKEKISPDGPPSTRSKIK